MAAKLIATKPGPFLDLIHLPSLWLPTDPMAFPPPLTYRWTGLDEAAVMYMAVLASLPKTHL